ESLARRRCAPGRRAVGHPQPRRGEGASRHGLPSPVLDRCYAKPSLRKDLRILRNKEVLARRLLAALFAAVLTVGLGGCGNNTDSWVDAAAAPGWPAQYGNAANSSYTTTDCATKLALRWTRSVKGSLAAGPALSSRGWLALNAQTPAGCSLMEW